MEFKDTSVSELKLNVSTGDVCDDSLDKLVKQDGEFKDIFGNKFKIEVSIVGASHLVTVSNKKTNEVVFKEVLANVDLTSVAKPNQNLTLYKNEDISKGSEINKEYEDTGIKYKFVSEILSIKELQSFRAFVTDSMLCKSTKYDKANLQVGDPILLKYTFPCDVETAIEAQTLIKFSCFADRMLITSYHVYPNNDAAFVSFSEIVTTRALPEKGSFTIVSNDLFVENMIKAGVDRKTALDILEKSAPLEKMGEDVFQEFKEDLGQMFDAFNQAAEVAKDKIESIDKDEIIDNVKVGINKFFDSLKSRKE